MRTYVSLVVSFVSRGRIRSSRITGLVSRGISVFGNGNSQEGSGDSKEFHVVVCRNAWIELMSSPSKSCYFILVSRARIMQRLNFESNVAAEREIGYPALFMPFLA